MSAAGCHLSAMCPIGTRSCASLPSASGRWWQATQPRLAKSAPPCGASLRSTAPALGVAPCVSMAARSAAFWLASAPVKTLGISECGRMECGSRIQSTRKSFLNFVPSSESSGAIWPCSGMPVPLAGRSAVSLWQAAQFICAKRSRPSRRCVATLSSLSVGCVRSVGGTGSSGKSFEAQLRRTKVSPLSALAISATMRLAPLFSCTVLMPGPSSSGWPLRLNLNLPEDSALSLNVPRKGDWRSPSHFAVNGPAGKNGVGA